MNGNMEAKNRKRQAEYFCSEKLNDRGEKLADLDEICPVYNFKGEEQPCQKERNGEKINGVRYCPSDHKLFQKEAKDN